MSKTKTILFFVIYLIFNIAINTVHPITTDYIHELEMDPSYFGLLYSLMSLGQVAGAFLWGLLSDKIGRKWIIFTGIVGYCLAQLGFGYINQWPILLLVFRFISGIFASAPVTLFVSMALDYSSKENKVKYLSALSFCSVLGLSLGYEIGGDSHTYGGLSFQHVFLIQLGIGLFAALLFAIFMKDKKLSPEEAEQTIKKPAKAKFSFKNFKNLNYLVIILLLALFFLTFGQILIQKYLDPFFIDQGFNSAELGHYVLITGIVTAFANLLIIPVLKKIKDKRLVILLISFIGVSAGLTFITFLVKTNNMMILLWSSHFIYLILKGLIQPLEQNELSTYSTIKNNGQIMGARQTILSIAKVLGPLLGAAIYSTANPLIFIIAAAILLLSFAIYITYFILKYSRKSQNEVNGNEND